MHYDAKRCDAMRSGGCAGRSGSDDLGDGNARCDAHLLVLQKPAARGLL